MGGFRAARRGRVQQRFLEQLRPAQRAAERTRLGRRRAAIDGRCVAGDRLGFGRYLARRHLWKYFTEGEGLPSNQISAIAFSPSGDLLVGTRCNGLAMASARDDFQSWRAIPGPEKTPPHAIGVGLPSAQINALLAMREGRLYAGTARGLAWSDDDGQSWQWVRGKNWQTQVRGQWPKPQTNAVEFGDLPNEEAPALLSEDYVSCLKEDDAGHLLIGHRRTGWEMRDGRAQNVLLEQTKPDTVRDFAIFEDSLIVAGYGGGLWQQTLPEKLRAKPVTTQNPALAAASPEGVVIPYPHFPAPATLPTLARLEQTTARVRNHQEFRQNGDAAYLGADWETRGDWMGRYGRQMALLCAMQAPTDHQIAWSTDYQIDGFNGPHQNPGDGLRRWLHWERSEDDRVLYNPFLGYRREAEWDDHGETYDADWEGPDVWVKLLVPAGTHRLSLYFFNKDGHAGAERWRDYLIEIKGRAENVEAAALLPTLANARVSDFWDGVYQRFSLQGPGNFWVRVARNGSFNTTLNGIFLDNITDANSNDGPGLLPMTGNSGYHALYTNPPDPLPTGDKLPIYRAFLELWNAIDVSAARRGAADDRALARILAYRALAGAGGSVSERANWRWHIPLWAEDDRILHLQRMKDAFVAQAELEARYRNN